MQKTILLQLVILVCILSCQSNQDVEVLPPGIKFIKKYYKNDTLFLEEHYNTDSTYSFSKEKEFISDKWVGKFNTYLSAVQFDDKDNVLMEIYANSSLGFEISIYKKINDTLEHIMKITDGYDQEDVGNYKNQFRYISEINSSDELINHPQIQKMLKNGNPFLERTRIKDNINNVISETLFVNVEVLDTTFTSVITYDNNHNIQLIDNGDEKEYYIYNGDNNLIKGYVVSTSDNTENIKEEHIYDGKNLVKSIYPNYLTSTFEYNQKGQVVKEIEKQDFSKENEYIEKTYFYQKDKLVKRIETKFPQKISDEYRFEYIER